MQQDYFNEVQRGYRQHLDQIAQQAQAHQCQMYFASFQLTQYRGLLMKQVTVKPDGSWQGTLATLIDSQTLGTLRSEDTQLLPLDAY